MNDLIAALLSTLLATLLVAIVGGILLARRYKLTPKNLKLPFADFDASRFADLSAVKLFAHVSRVAIIPSASALKWLRKRPEISALMLIHVGWQIVSNAFVVRYMAYPSEENVTKQAHEIGVQNVEFIILFEKIYRQSIRYEENLDFEFAQEYFLRAPSLATRISGDATHEDDGLFQLIATFLPKDGLE